MSLKKERTEVIKSIIAICAFLTLLSVLIFKVQSFVFPPKRNTEIALRYTGDQPEKVQEAMTLLLDSCPDLSSYLDDIQYWEASYDDISEDPYMYLKERLGWNEYVSINPHVKQDAHSIPREFRTNGHTLYYYINTKYGIIMKKDQSVNLCSNTLNTSACGSDVYLDASGEEHDPFCK